MTRSIPLSLFPFAQKLQIAFQLAFHEHSCVNPWEAVAKLAADELPIRCSECKELEHQPHLPTCHRYGNVTIDSDLRFKGRALNELREQVGVSHALTLEVDRLRKILSSAPHDNRCAYVRLKGPDMCDCWQKDIKLQAPLGTFAAGSIDWLGSFDEEESRL